MNEQDVGLNIRSLREQQGHTLTALAKRAGIAKSSLSKIETGQVSAPISTLMRIAEALNSRLAAFFTERDDPPPFVYTPKGHGKRITRDGAAFGYAYEGLALSLPNKTAEPFLLTIQPGNPPGKFSHGGEEYIYMLEGRMKFTIGETELTLTPGDSLYFDPSLTHTTSVIGKETVRFLCLFISQSPQVAHPQTTTTKDT